MPAEAYTFKTHCGLTRVYRWPEIKAELSHNGETWIPDAPVWRFFIPEHAAMTSRTTPVNAVEWYNNAERIAFCSSVPAEINQAITPFADHQWNVLDLFHHNESATMDLMNSNPVLAFCLANAEEFRTLAYSDSSAERAVWMLHRKQTEILKWLHLPDTKPVVKILKKIIPEAIGIPEMRLLCNALRCEPRVMHILSHMQHISAQTLPIIYSLSILDMFSNRFIFELVESGMMDNLADYFFDVFELHHQLHPRTTIPTFQSLKKVEAYQEQLSHEYNQTLMAELIKKRLRKEERRERMRKGIYDSAPIPGNEHIIPIKNKGQLIDEGTVMNNCVASYHRQIINRKSYIYKVTYPERATLQLTKNAYGGWYCAQVKAPSNRSVRPETMKYIYEWMNTLATGSNLNAL